MKNLTVTVAVGEKAARRTARMYCFIIHPNGPDELMLSKKFYEDFGTLPTSTQFEIEIPSWFSPEFDGLIHVHKSDDGKRKMMCYPLPIPSLGIALEKIIVWAVGTAFTEETKRDFQEVFKGNTLTFLTEMENVHHIKILSIQPT